MRGQAPFLTCKSSKTCITILRHSAVEPMIQDEIQSAHRALWHWCRPRDFAGYAPYDGLNSRVFQATPLKHSRVARLAWTQLFKRSPFNLRRLVRVPAGR